MGDEIAAWEKKTCSVLDELNLDPVGNSTVGEKLLLFSKEIRVEIKFGELPRNLVIETVEVDKLPKRKGVGRDKPRVQERFGRPTAERW